MVCVGAARTVPRESATSGGVWRLRARTEVAGSDARGVCEKRPVLFDAKLLADRIGPEALGARPSLVAPFCPPLTQGWSYLFENVAVHPIVRKAGEYLLPGLWTTFAPQGVGLLKDGLGAAELR